MWQGLVRIVAELGHSWSQKREAVLVWPGERIRHPDCCGTEVVALACRGRVLPIQFAHVVVPLPL